MPEQRAMSKGNSNQQTWRPRPSPVRRRCCILVGRFDETSLLARFGAYERTPMMPACTTLGKCSSNGGSTRWSAAWWRFAGVATVTILAAVAIGRSATLGKFDPGAPSSSELQESILLDLLRNERRSQKVVRPDTTTATATTATTTTTTTTSSAQVARGSAAAATTDDREGPGATQQTPTKTTLALLYPPGLQGGYRNQVLRMVALCQYALVNNRTLFLPSVWWSTQRKTRRKMSDPYRANATNVSTEHSLWYPVPMDLIFDVDHWNQYSRENPASLPLLVDNLPPRRSDKDSNRSGDCWSTPVPQRQQQSTNDVDYLQRELEHRGHLVPVANWTQKLLQWPPAMDVLEYNPRRHDLLPLVEHCTRPYVHGGGKMAGRLWNEYLGLAQKALTTKQKEGNVSQDNEGVYESVLRALQPRAKWRQVGIEHCLMMTQSVSRDDSTDYAAVHARIEPEMMAHPCGRNMERNLTVILDHVAHLLKNQSSTLSTATPSIVVAVSREGLVDPRFPQFMELSRANLQTLNDYTGISVVKEDVDEEESRPDRQPVRKRKLLHDQFPVVECGGEMMARYYRSLTNDSNNDRIADDDDTYGTLLEQVINFDLAVQAKAFVGVEWSSYSNAIWTTRFLLDKGANYKYTKSGIEPVIGMPPPHSNCPRGSAAAARGNRKRPP